MVKSANPMITMRPAGPRTRRTSGALRGMRTFTSLFCAVLGTKSNSRMDDRSLSAAGAGVEVQVYGIAWQIHGYEVAHIDAQAIGRVGDVHVVRRHGEIEAVGFIEDEGAQGVVGAGRV